MRQKRVEKLCLVNISEAVELLEITGMEEGVLFSNLQAFQKSLGFRGFSLQK